MKTDLTELVTHTEAPINVPYVEPEPPARPCWIYTDSDPALMLFTAAWQRFGMTFPAGSAVLELGCMESDWLERMARYDPSLRLTGVDARAQVRDSTGFTLVEGDATDATLFPAQSFDRIVLLGALEHFGLGYYGDLDNPYGDHVAMQNVARWLKPGGFVYFDVPVQPTFRVTENRHFRMYSPHGLAERLLPWPLKEVNRAYSLPEPYAGTWCGEPTWERVPYWFAAVLAEKPTEIP